MLSPGLCEHGSSSIEHLVDDGTIDIGTIDMHFCKSQFLATDVFSDWDRSLFLWPVGRSDCASDNSGVVEIASDVFLIAIKALGLALASVPHLIVYDRDAAIWSNSLPDLSGPFLGDLKVLVTHLRNRLNVWAKWLRTNVIQVSLHPALQ